MLLFLGVTVLFAACDWLERTYAFPVRQIGQTENPALLGKAVYRGDDFRLALGLARAELVIMHLFTALTRCCTCEHPTQSTMFRMTWKQNQ